MAATIYTALLQVYDNPDPAQTLNALDYARPFDSLGPDDWRALREAAIEHDGQTLPQIRAAIRKVVYNILPTYARVWDELDRPRTLEEWVARKYPATRNDAP